MGHGHALSPEAQRKEDIGVGVKGFVILLIITFAEVGIALVGNGHIGGMEFPKVIMVPVMIALSLYKAYYIVSIFMHLGHEVRSMAMSIVLPMLLLVWAVIAFLWDGNSARENRNYVTDEGDPSKEQVEPKDDVIGMTTTDKLSKTVSFQ